MIFDQSNVKKGKSKGTCSFYAVLGAIVDRYSLDVSQEKLEEYIDSTKRRTANVPWILNFLKEHPFEGYRCTGWEVLYSKKREAKLHAPTMEKIRTIARYKEKVCLVAVPIYHKESPLIHLDENHTFVSYHNPVIESHAVYMRGLSGPMKYEMVNSWGTDFGKKGVFYLHSGQFHNDVTAVYSASFEKIT